jgi:hypothetical protein
VALFVGLDLGQSADFTALAVVQSVKEANEDGKLRTLLHLRHLERYPLRTPYTDVADAVAALMRSETLNRDEYDPSRHRVARPKVELLVDKTGVGVAVTDLLKERDLKFTSVTIHGGEKVTRPLKGRLQRAQARPRGGPGGAVPQGNPQGRRGPPAMGCAARGAPELPAQGKSEDRPHLV